MPTVATTTCELANYWLTAKVSRERQNNCKHSDLADRIESTKMSFSSVEDLSEAGKLAQRRVDPIVKSVPENLTPGRKLLRSWLSNFFRVIITDGRILVGAFNCTDKDANIVLAMCVEYLKEDGEPRVLGNVMIPGKHIVSIEVEKRIPDRD